MTEIKPCPFCGSECIIISKFLGGIINKYRVRCNDNNRHSLDSWCASEEEAIAEWNERV